MKVFLMSSPNKIFSPTSEIVQISQCLKKWLRVKILGQIIGNYIYLFSPGYVPGAFVK